jgi:hypothetical protein
MELTTNVNRATHVKRWIQLWNGGIKLTDKEAEFFGELLERALEMTEQGVKEPYLGELLFSTKTMAEIKEKLEIASKQSINHYKTSLKSKGVIYKDEDGIYHVHANMIPQLTITFKFNYE